MDINGLRVLEVRSLVRGYAQRTDRYLPLVVIDLVMEGFSIKEIISIKIEDFDGSMIALASGEVRKISYEVMEDIHTFLSESMELNILNILLETGGLRLADLSRKFGRNNPGSWSGFYYSYIRRLLKDKAIFCVKRKGKKYYTTTEEIRDHYIDNLYLTRIRLFPSTKESLRGHFKTALRAANCDSSLTPTTLVQSCPT